MARTSAKPSPQKQMVQVQYRPLSALKKHPKNPRTIKDTSFKKLVTSIRENPDYFEARPIILSDRTGELIIIAGNQRFEAARDIGIKDVPTALLPELTEEKEREIMIRDNIANGEWDWDMLANEWDSAELTEWGLDVPGWEDGSGAGNAGQIDADDAPEPEEEAVSILGDLWILGEHRLSCGDSTKLDVIALLMQGAMPDMIFTDPPYGIAHTGKGITANGVKGNDFGEILGDQDVSVAQQAFALCASEYSESTLIFWGANYYPSVLPDGHGWIVWDKQREGDTFSGAELAFVNGGVRVDVFRHMWHGMVKASEHGQARVHPTQKPIALAEWCFERYGAPSLVLDLFGGSGSTLIACEKTGRQACLMELDPRYCDVIIKRWQDFTGNQAILEATGETFEEVKHGRAS